MSLIRNFARAEDTSPPQTPLPPVAQKRPRDLDALSDEATPRKSTKGQLAQEPTHSLAFSAVVPTPQATVRLSVNQLDDARVCDEAVGDAIRLFRDSLFPFLTDRYVHGKEEEVADERAEKRSSDKCQDLRKAFVALLPWAGKMDKVPDATIAGGGYDVLHFDGHDPPTHLDFYNKLVEKNDWDGALEAQLELFRCQGPRSRAWDGLLALSAVMGSRKEKNWLDQNDCNADVEEGLKKLGMFRDKDLKRLKRCPKGMKCRQNAIRTIVREICRIRIYGYFAHYLGSSQHHFRLAVARGVSGHVPASIVITSQLPLWDALHFHTEDKEGSPFKGAAKGKSFRLEDNPWLKEPGRQFAFQEANTDADPDSALLCRKLASTLEPDPQLKKLLVTSEPVLLLDVVSSLAPRDLAKSEGLSAIVKAEIKNVFEQARSRGQAVLLELGSADPHDLAKKVYLPLGAQYGLRCGYIRWRDSDEVPWAREGPWADRGCVCLQMP
jgi:hypothetical protein